MECWYRWTEVARRWSVTLVNGLYLFAADWATKFVAAVDSGSDGSLLNGMLCGGKETARLAAVRSAGSGVDRSILGQVVALFGTMRTLIRKHEDTRFCRS